MNDPLTQPLQSNTATATYNQLKDFSLYNKLWNINAAEIFGGHNDNMSHIRCSNCGNLGPDFYFLIQSQAYHSLSWDGPQTGAEGVIYIYPDENDRENTGDPELHCGNCGAVVQWSGDIEWG